MSYKYQISKEVKTIIIVSKEMSYEQMWGFLSSNEQDLQEAFEFFPFDQDKDHFNNFQANAMNGQEVAFSQNASQGSGEIIEERNRIFQDAREGNGAMLDQADEGKVPERITFKSRNARLFEQNLRYKERRLNLKKEQMKLRKEQLRLLEEKQKIILNITEMVNKSPPEERNAILELSKSLIQQLREVTTRRAKLKHEMI